MDLDVVESGKEIVIQDDFDTVEVISKDGEIIFNAIENCKHVFVQKDIAGEIQVICLHEEGGCRHFIVKAGYTVDVCNKTKNINVEKENLKHVVTEKSFDEKVEELDDHASKRSDCQTEDSSGNQDAYEVTVTCPNDGKGGKRVLLKDDLPQCENTKMSNDQLCKCVFADSTKNIKAETVRENVSVELENLCEKSNSNSQTTGVFVSEQQEMEVKMEQMCTIAGEKNNIECSFNVEREQSLRSNVKIRLNDVAESENKEENAERVNKNTNSENANAHAVLWGPFDTDEKVAQDVKIEFPAILPLVDENEWRTSVYHMHCPTASLRVTITSKTGSPIRNLTNPSEVLKMDDYNINIPGKKKGIFRIKPKKNKTEKKNIPHQSLDQTNLNYTHKKEKHKNNRKNNALESSKKNEEISSRVSEFSVSESSANYYTGVIDDTTEDFVEVNLHSPVPECRVKLGRFQKFKNWWKNKIK